MDIFWTVVVIVLLVALVGYIVFLYMKEAGPGSTALWLTGTRLFRPSISGQASMSTVEVEAGARSVPLMEDVEMIETVQLAQQLVGPERGLVVEEERLRELKEEFQRELRDAVGRSREFDARLTRVEHFTQENDLPTELAGLKESHRAEIERIQVSLETVRLRSGAHGERQGAALAELYGHLARVESSLAAVINPMLLPGELLSLPAELPAESLIWTSWSDVGERAYAFGNVFNENRLVLEADTGDEIAAFISTLRQGLTGAVYPAIRHGKPSAEQVVQLRAGLQTIVDALPGVRRRIEGAYRDGR